MIRCDFCLAADPPWEFPAGEINIPEAEWRSIGPWTACDSCRELIDANDRDGLAARAEAQGVSDFVAARYLHERFFAARRGPARPIEPTPLHGHLFES